MPHYLWKAVIGPTPKVPISATAYRAIEVAWHALATIANIEEEWDCLIQNYLDLELELMRSAVNSMVLSRGSYEEYQDERVGFARRLANLMSSARSYLDHTPHYLDALPDDTLSAKFGSLTSGAYDNDFSYRFMKALRNYAQHRGLPLHGTSYDARWVGDGGQSLSGRDDKAKLRHAVTASVDVERLMADKKFKASIRTELGAMGTSKLDVAESVREYVEDLGKVHAGLRALLQGYREKWMISIRNAIERYAAKNDGDVIGLSIAVFGDDGRVEEHTNIFEELPARVQRLSQKNGNLVNLRRRYVSSEILKSRHA